MRNRQTTGPSQPPAVYALTLTLVVLAVFAVQAILLYLSFSRGRCRYAGVMGEDLGKRREGYLLATRIALCALTPVVTLLGDYPARMTVPDLMEQLQRKLQAIQGTESLNGLPDFSKYVESCIGSLEANQGGKQFEAIVVDLKPEKRYLTILEAWTLHTKLKVRKADTPKVVAPDVLAFIFKREYKLPGMQRVFTTITKIDLQSLDVNFPIVPDGKGYVPYRVKSIVYYKEEIGWGTFLYVDSPRSSIRGMGNWVEVNKFGCDECFPFRITDMLAYIRAVLYQPITHTPSD